MIGEHCLISQQVTIVGSNHGTSLGTPVQQQPWRGGGVIIEDDVWVGAGSYSCPASTLATGPSSLLGASSPGLWRITT